MSKWLFLYIFIAFTFQANIPINIKEVKYEQILRVLSVSPAAQNVDKSLNQSIKKVLWLVTLMLLMLLSRAHTGSGSVVVGVVVTSQQQQSLLLCVVVWAATAHHITVFKMTPWELIFQWSNIFALVSSFIIISVTNMFSVLFITLLAISGAMSQVCDNDIWK